MRARQAAWIAAAALTAACNTPAPAVSGLPAPRVISGSINAASSCGGPIPSRRPGEPQLAVDPTNRSRLIAAWIDTPRIVVAESADGGGHWTRMLLPGVLQCDGGRFATVADPWVSIGPDGLVYVSYLGVTATSNAVVVSVGRDHGSSWSPPIVVATSQAGSEFDKPSILADQRRSGIAYVVWADYVVNGASQPSVDTVTFGRTTDGGKTWSAPAKIAGGKDEAQENQLLMTAGGVLLDVFVEGSSLPGGAAPPPLPVTARVVRSTDQGAAWSPPIDAASFTYTAAVDPGNGSELRAGGQDIVATASGNAIYVSWFEDHRDFSTILLARSDTAGKTWNKPAVVVREKAEAFLPTIAVSGSGTLGMLWYDLRHFTADGTGLTTDVWFSTSTDRGAHWTERHAAGPFDLRSAPASRYGPFIGDYMGLVGVPTGFDAVFVMSRPQSRNGPTDVFFSHIAA